MAIAADGRNPGITDRSNEELIQLNESTATRAHRCADQATSAARLGRGGRGADAARSRSTGATARRRSTTELCQELVDAGHVREALRRQAAELLPRALRPRRRRARRGPHLHLLRATRTTPARPTTGASPAEMRETLAELFGGSMRGPHDVRRAVLDGPARLADRPHRRPAHRLAVRRRVSMRIMTRMGQAALDVLGEDGEFVPCLHSVGTPLADGRRRTCRGRATRTTSTSSTSPRRARSGRYGSGYGGNALLGKKCFALRIASVMARDEGWLAEHMLILKLTSPEGEVKYVAGAFPSRLRQDQPRDADPDASRAGRSRRSATTSPG